MSSLTELKASVLKEVTSILASAQHGLSVGQAQRDYQDLIGKPLPCRDMGFASADEFFKSVPESISVHWEGGQVILKAVPTEKTEKIIKLIQKNKPNTRKPRQKGAPRFVVPNTHGKQVGGRRSNSSGYRTYDERRRYDQDRTRSSWNKPFRINTQSSSTPALTRKEICDLLRDHPNGLPVGCQFDDLFKKMYGRTLNYSEYGFPTMSAFFKSLRDIVTVSYTKSGGCKVSLLEKPTAKQERMLSSSTCSPRAAEEVSPVLKKSIQQVLQKYPAGVPCAKFQQVYKGETGQNFPLRRQGCESVIEFMDSLTDIVYMEKQDNREWILFDACRGQDPSRQKRHPSSKLSLNTNNSSTAPTVPEGVLREIRQVVLGNNGLPLERLPRAYLECTGKELDVGGIGFATLQDLIVMCTDVLSMQYQGQGNITLHRLSEDEDIMYTEKAIRTSSQNHAYAEKTKSIPEDSVGPGCAFPVLYLMFSSGDNIEVHVSQVDSPGVFWIQIRGNNTTVELENVMDRLEDVYKHRVGEEYVMPERLIKPGQVCAACFAEDGNWHRAVITKIHDEDYVWCYYVDYGTTATATKKSLRLLRNSFLSFPQQALKARLAFIHPTEGQWSTAAKNRFLNMVHNRPLVAFVTGISEDRVVSVCLIDTNGDDDVHINDTLREEGYAEFAMDGGGDASATATQECPQRQLATTEAVHRSADPRTENTNSSYATVEDLDEKMQDVNLREDRLSDDVQSILLGESATEPGVIPESDVPRVKRVDLNEKHALHMIRLNEKPHVTSAEISAILWEKDLLRSMMRQVKMNPPKEIIEMEECPELFEELTSFEVKGVRDGERIKTHVMLYELSLVPDLLEKFAQNKEIPLKEIRREIDIFETFDEAYMYWTDFTVEDNSQFDDEESVESVDKVYDLKKLQADLSALRSKRGHILKQLQGMEHQDNLSDIVHELLDVEEEVKEKCVIINKLKESETGSVSPQNEGNTTRVAKPSSVVGSSTSSSLRATANIFTPSRSEGAKTNAVVPMPCTKAMAPQSGNTVPQAIGGAMAHAMPAANINTYVPMIYPMMDPTAHFQAQNMAAMQRQYLPQTQTTLSQDQQSFLEQYRAIINQSASNMCIPSFTGEYMTMPGFSGAQLPMQGNVPQQTSTLPGYSVPPSYPQMMSQQPASYPQTNTQPGTINYPFQYM